MNHSWSVTELTGYLKQALENDLNLTNLSVVGEVSNLSSPPSGHRYFRLKDAQNVVQAVMWANRPGIEYLREGEQVLATGKMTFYGRGGNCNFQSDSVVPLGEGSLSVEFERLKAKLELEGLFDLNRKRDLPMFPKVVGVVTSASGSVWQDIQNVLRRRYPLCELLLSHSSVQGVDAAEELREAIEILNLEGRSDVIILARGGGSLEDLWPFNEEQLARAIFASKIPIVSGVGHETDITIADLVADMRAPTPSAAAELIAPDVDNLRLDLNTYTNRAIQNLNNSLSMNKYKLMTLTDNVNRAAPNLDEHRRSIDEYFQRFCDVYESAIRERRNVSGAAESQLRILDFSSVLARGFAYVQNASDGLPIRSSRELAPRDMIRLTFDDGQKSAEVID